LRARSQSTLRFPTMSPGLGIGVAFGFELGVAFGFVAAQTSAAANNVSRIDKIARIQLAILIVCFWAKRATQCRARADSSIGRSFLLVVIEPRAAGCEHHERHAWLRQRKFRRTFAGQSARVPRHFGN